jgi:Xaa-Pro aminopeptidase
VLAEKAAIFVDGRYTVQVREQVDTSLFTPEHLIDHPPEQWIKKNVKAGMRIGFDPWLHTHEGTKRLEEACTAIGASLVAVDSNPIDAVWSDRPAIPLAPVTLHRPTYAGEEAEAKIKRIQSKLADMKADAVVITDAHAVAWIFNIRGGDVGHTPLPLGFAIVPQQGKPELFMDGRKFSNATRDAVANLAEIAEPSVLDVALDRLGKAKARVRFDGATAATRLVRKIEQAGGSADVGTDFVALMKARAPLTRVTGRQCRNFWPGLIVKRSKVISQKSAPRKNLKNADAIPAF